jgi:hypothetical protein
LFLTPLIAAVVIGSFWTGVGITAAANNNDFFGGPGQHRLFDDSNGYDNPSDVVISANTVSDHRDACSARYRSYNADRDMYRGFDGSWHLCRL